jgi:hypothetical protein
LAAAATVAVIKLPLIAPSSSSQLWKSLNSESSLSLVRPYTPGAIHILSRLPEDFVSSVVVSQSLATGDVESGIFKELLDSADQFAMSILKPLLALAIKGSRYWFPQELALYLVTMETLVTPPGIKDLTLAHVSWLRISHPVSA